MQNFDILEQFIKGVRYSRKAQKKCLFFFFFTFGKVIQPTLTEELSLIDFSG